jgi:hypothetical protein
MEAGDTLMIATVVPEILQMIHLNHFADRPLTRLSTEPAGIIRFLIEVIQTLIGMNRPGRRRLPFATWEGR